MQDKSDKKKEIEQLKDAEKKYQAYIAKRNELNDMAKILREEISSFLAHMLDAIVKR